jgi:hypothetical protein
MAQYVHNSWKSHTTGFTPFKLLLGYTPEIHLVSTVASTLPSLEETGNFLKQLQERAQEAIWIAQQNVLHLRNWTNGRQPFRPFTTGEKVWLDRKNLRLSHPSTKLAAQ